MHEEWTDRLSEYLDGELTDEERRAVDAHLKACAACAAVLADLERVVARAQSVAGAARPPAADLWSGIAARIDAGRDAQGGTTRTPLAFAPRASRSITFTLPQLAAAAAARRRRLGRHRVDDAAGARAGRRAVGVAGVPPSRSRLRPRVATRRTRRPRQPIALCP